MDRVVVTAEEITLTAPPPAAGSGGEPRPDLARAAAIPIWARICLAPLALLLPLLSIAVLVLRLITRSWPVRMRLAWISYGSTLLAISGLLTTVGTVVFLFASHTPVSVSQGLAELDSRESFPTLPAAADLTSVETSEKLNPLVTVISPVANHSLWRTEMPGMTLGAGVILQATKEGYLIATAKHVVDEMGAAKDSRTAMVASVTGVWSDAEVIGRHQSLDLALVWLKRREGKAEFELPVAPEAEVKVGEPIALIGHPQGLRYTLSTGIVSRKDQDVVQVSAPVSPGDSGGPVFDARGRLVAIVSSMVDKNSAPNAENLNFAVRADAFTGEAGWSFLGQGQRYLNAYRKAVGAAH